jgi:enoyl-CoA hydratase/carnithine racemase
LISVAEVQGEAFGFGFGLAILCDFALVAERAALGFPEMRHGLAPSAIMSYLGEYTLPRFAFPLVLFGDPMEPKRALQIGLISQIVPAKRLTAEADALIKRILHLDPAAARRCKQFFQNAQQNSFDENCPFPSMSSWRSSSQFTYRNFFQRKFACEPPESATPSVALRRF